MGNHVDMPPKELELLYFLAASPNQVFTREQLLDFPDKGYGYGLGFRTVIDPAAGDLNGSIGAFGWTGGFGSWCEADPAEGLSIVYMHNLIPNDEQYYHPRVRTASYGLLKSRNVPRLPHKKRWHPVFITAHMRRNEVFTCQISKT